jgi:hypothetical protein
MHYNIIAVALVALGFGLLFFLDTLIAKDTEYSMLKTVRDNNLMVGVVCLGAGYYVYTLGEKQKQGVSSTVEQPAELATSEPIVRNELPSYEEATSTDEIMNME